VTRPARPAAALLATAIAFLAVGASPRAQLFDPALRFQQLSTEHFVIYFHQGEERLAQRLARIAEETWIALQGPLGRTPPRRTRVVLADQTELFNGYATPVPYNTVVLYAVTPSGAGSNFDDWLRLIFTHEFTHIVHLDRSEGWARILRDVLGRTPYAFPNLFLPPWQIEGLATYEESVMTGEGRLHAGDFRAIVDEAARAHRLEPLDRINGGLTDWPGGAAVYAYGVGFHQYLADRFGPQTLAALADASARRLPYLSAPAFKRIFRESLGTLWRDYRDRATTIAASTAEPDANTTRLTHQGFSVSGPRFDRYPCAGCATDVVYTAVNPEGFPALYRVGVNGGDARRVVTRYLGATSAVGPEAIYFDQLELRRNVGLYSDLYAWSRVDGSVRQITSGARLLDPDLSPDGETLVCVQNRPGERDLVLVRVHGTQVQMKPDTPDGADPPVASGRSRTASIVTLIAEQGTQFDAPKWSPDGRTIAVERHRQGGLSEIVLVNAATGAVRVLASAPDTRFVTPAWRPDGGAIVAASAPVDATFNLIEVAVDGSSTRTITNRTGGALWPDVSPDGRTIVFVGYTTSGYDLFSLPYPTIVDAVVPNQIEPPLRADTPVTPDRPASGDLPIRSYSPLETLRPTSWTPIVNSDANQVRIGAALSAYDVLGYHAYAAAATWLVASPEGAQAPSTAAPDWQVSYLYERWRPTFYIAAASDTSFFAGPASAAGTATAATRREQQVEAGIIIPFRHTRVQHVARLAASRAAADFTANGSVFSRDRTPLRAAWQTNTAHTYGYSISPEDGVSLSATEEIVRRGLGSFADATTTTVDGRAYVRGLAAHHVVAVRLAGGASIGDATVGRTFLLGGDSPGGATDFGSTAFSLLRGFAPNTFAGSHVAVANAEYRWPIARPQRGYGTWPLFLHTVHAAVFVDAGHTWTRVFDRRAIKSSAGAQLSADVVAGFFAPFTVTIGAARGHDGSGLVGDRTTAYFRVGKGF
jgi:hypothetical protein